MASLALAQEIRTKRAEAKRALAAMTRQEAIEAIGRLLDHPPSWAGTWRISQVLLALPGFGVKKAQKLLHHTGLSDSITVGRATARQRGLVISALSATIYDKLDQPVGFRAQ
jgi:hypothetical protein